MKANSKWTAIIDNPKITAEPDIVHNVVLIWFSTVFDSSSTRPNFLRRSVHHDEAIEAIKNRERRMLAVIFLVFILLIVTFSSYFTYNFLNQPQNQTTNPTTNPTSSRLKVAIVDQLSLTFPNQTFIETATNTLKQAGYTVDYYPGEEVTVEFYRVHSALGEEGKPPVALFTSEPVAKNKYAFEILADWLQGVSFSEEDWKKGIIYYGIMPGFVSSSMNGEFDNTTIITMGWNGLTYTTLAQSFVQKGAKVCIGWNGSVLASHTDQAITNFLQHLILEKQTIKQAVDKTMKEVGSDPADKSILTYYPLEAGEQTVESING